MAGEDSNDDDYMPTVKEKEKVEKEKRREMQQKLQDGEFISNATERAKVFKWELWAPYYVDFSEARLVAPHLEAL